MSSDQVVVHGRIRPDGTLELSQPVGLPPGEVQVTVAAVPEATMPNEDLGTLMERIWAGQRARGYQPRTREEIDAELNQMRDEAEEEMLEIERLQEECERQRRLDGPSGDRST
jgi:hypothetical protein